MNILGASSGAVNSSTLLAVTVGTLSLYRMSTLIVVPYSVRQMILSSAWEVRLVERNKICFEHSSYKVLHSVHFLLKYTRFIARTKCTVLTVHKY